MVHRPIRTYYHNVSGLEKPAEFNIPYVEKRLTPSQPIYAGATVKIFIDYQIEPSDCLRHSHAGHIQYYY